MRDKFIVDYIRGCLDGGQKSFPAEIVAKLLLKYDLAKETYRERVQEEERISERRGRWLVKLCKQRNYYRKHIDRMKAGTE